MSEEQKYAVFRDENRHHCLRVSVDRKHTRFIPMSVTELSVFKLTNDEFAATHTEVPDYDVRRAAQRFVYRGDGVQVVATPEARTHLERMAGPEYVIEQLGADVPDPADILRSTTPKKEPEMSKTTAPAKQAAPAKKAPPPSAKKAEAAAKKAAPAKKAAATEAGTRGRKPTIDGSAKITVIAKENPKRAAAAERFALYKNGMTVDAYIEAGGTRADVNWDVKSGFISVK